MPSSGVRARSDFGVKVDNPQAAVAELARMAALFQQRAIAAHLGFGPTAQRPPVITPNSEVQ